MEMVKYWKTGESVQAKVTELDGVTVMYMDGEKYPFPGFPRGHLLYGKLSKLKHEIKNQIFNDSWKLLEGGMSEEEVVRRMPWGNICTLFEDYRYDTIPEEKMVPSVRELHRAWGKVAPDSKLRDIVCFILQEDDAYRFRFQWIVSYFCFSFDPLKRFEKGLEWLEHGEIIGDMKERVRLIRRILMIILRQPEMRVFFKRLYREIDWSKVKLTKADKYFFRGKYFKVDLDKFDY